MHVTPSSQRPRRLGRVDSAIVFLLLVSGCTAILGLSHGGTAAQSTMSLEERPVGPSLVVAPFPKYVLAGATQPLHVRWVGVPSNCSGFPLWYRWEIDNGSLGGALGQSTEPTANFTAETGTSGFASIVVRSGLLLQCGSTQRLWMENASANVTVEVPPSLENLTVAPNPIPTGSDADLSAIVAGGLPPYRLRVAWGDGNVSFFSIPEPGPVSVPHRFPSGSFVPSVLVTDSANFSANGTVATPVSASDGMAIAIHASTPETAVDVAVEFSGEILRPPPSFGYSAACTDALDFEMNNSSSGPWVNFTCTFARSGLATVSFEVTPIGDDLPPLGTQWSETIAAPLGLNVSASSPVGAAGQPSSVTAWVTGGVPPFRLIWLTSWNSSYQETTAYADGPVALPVPLLSPGNVSVSVEVADATGNVAKVADLVLSVDAPLEAGVGVNRTLGPAGALVEMEGDVEGGVSPFDFYVVPQLDPGTPYWGSGVLTSDGPFSWNGSLSLEGNDTFEIGVVDADGSAWSESVPVALVPPLNVTARWNVSANASGEYVAFQASISGGLPPFVVSLASTDRESWNCTVTSDGSYAWQVATAGNGTVEYSLWVRDQIGAVVETNTTLDLVPGNASSGSQIPPTNPPPSSSSPPRPTTALGAGGATAKGSLALGALGLLALVGLAVLFLRRRRRAEPESGPVPDPVAVVRRIVEPAEGAERSTVELLAEEEGVPMAVAHATIDRLIADGTLRAETGDDGEEVLAWSEPS